MCNFVTDVMRNLYLDMATKMTSFRKDTKAAEKTAVTLFLEAFPEGLAVYSGSDRVGYYRLSDEQMSKPPDMMNFVTSPKFALSFELKGRSTSAKLKVTAVRKYSLYLTEDLVMEYVKKNDKDNIKQKIEKLFNRIHIYEIRDICPAILNKIADDHGKMQEVRSKIKMNCSTSVNYWNLVADDVKQVLTVHTSLDKKYKDLIINETRMHSSRMRTGRTLTVFRGEPPPPRKFGEPPPKKDPPPKIWRNPPNPPKKHPPQNLEEPPKKTPPPEIWRTPQKKLEQNLEHPPQIRAKSGAPPPPL